MKYYVFFCTALISLFTACKKNTSNDLSNSIKTNESVAEKPNIIWEEKYFVDDFGDKTNNKYIRSLIDGLFSNTATSNSYLGVEIIFRKNIAGLFLHEYRYSNPAEYFFARIKMKNSKGEILEIRGGSQWNKKGGITIEDRYLLDENKDFTKFKNFLITGGKIKTVVTYENTVYEFIIDASDFENMYNTL